LDTSNEEELRAKRDELTALKLARLAQLEQEIELKRRLPFKHAGKLYPWQREWIDCMDKEQALTAANQVGKSRTMQIKCLTWIFSPELWPLLWPEMIAQGKYPSVFWYCYPIREMASSEFYDKWVPLLPPEDDPEYGWRIEKTREPACRPPTAT
jgi:hypothetical protein